MQQIVVSVTNDLVTDQRVKKVCSTLQEMNFNITLIGRNLPDSLPLKRNYKTIRMNLLFKKGFLFYAEYNIRLFFKLFFLKKKDILLANDLDTLLPNYLISKIFNKKLVYDSHELFTEVPELINRPRIRSVWLTIEKFIFPKLKNVYTVNNEIAKFYTDKYQIPVKVIKNVPLKLNSIKKTKLSFNTDNKKIILYQGALNVGRGLELMILSMQLLDNFIFIIIGDGDIESKLKELVINKKLSKKVLFLGRIIPKKLIRITKNTDIGISLEEDLGLSYRLSLPNKIFDYIQAGIPVIASNLPVIKALFKKYKVGEILMLRSPENLASIVKKIDSNKQSYSKQLKKAADFYTWERESQKLIKIFNTLK